MKTKTGRNAQMFIDYHNGKMTFQEIGNKYNLSSERAREIINRTYVALKITRRPIVRKMNLKLTVEKVKEIKLRLSQGVSCSQIAREEHVCRQNIFNIKCGKIWKHVKE